MSSGKNNRTADSSSSVIGTRTVMKKTCFCCPQMAVEQTPKKTGCKVTKKTRKKTNSSVDRVLRSKNNIQTRRVPRDLVNLGTNILDTSIVLRNDNYTARKNKISNKYSRLSEPKIITSYQYSKDQYFKIEILKGNRKQIEEFEEVTNVEESNKRCLINLTMAQSQVLHDGGCLLIKKGIFPVDVKLTKINDPASQVVSKKNYNGEIIINNVINVKKYSEPSSETKSKINSSTERITNFTKLPEQTNQIVKNLQTPKLVKNKKKHSNNSKTEENDIATAEPKRKRFEARSEVSESMSKKKGNRVRKLVINQGDSTIQKKQVCTNVNVLSPFKVHCNNSKRKLKNSSSTTVVNNEKKITQSSKLNGPLKANVNNNVKCIRSVGRSNPIENEILPASSNTPIIKVGRSNPIENEILPTSNTPIIKVGRSNPIENEILPASNTPIIKVCRSNPIENEILPASNTPIIKVYDTSLIDKMIIENIEENEKITEDINTEEDSVLLVEDDPVNCNTPRRWLQEIKTITKVTTIIKTREIPAEQEK
ncbi:Hypothetical protein CINCED_3A007038 [Cinara cedri]|uniref:Uncharacterized protein n=1 Tax=Cinara cedri TaxID=506608 RepID=A0A5E4MXW1_9HEMI|nr:Hypothetical protein CINCED_3A007038 [Cinara cedri]